LSNLRDIVTRSSILCLLVAGCCYPASAQKKVGMEFGVRAGIPFSVPLESDLTGAGATFSSFAFERSKFSVGPAVTAVVMDRVAVEFDAVYKPMRFRSSFSSPFVLPISTTRAASWEFPLIADYRFLSGSVRPYGGGGLLLGQSLSGTTDTQTVDLRTGAVTTSRGSFRPFLSQLPAYVINGGLEWSRSKLVIRPELRFTRWSSVSQPADVARRDHEFQYSIGFSFKGFAR
jgi:hypothetical protein